MQCPSPYPKCPLRTVPRDTARTEMITYSYANIGFEGYWNRQCDLAAAGKNSHNRYHGQLIVCTGICSMYFQGGLCLGTATVVIPRMREEKGEDYISQEMASWMYSATSYSSLPWVPVLAISASYIGRRYTFGLGVAASLVSFLMLYAANTPLLVLGSLIAQGLASAMAVVAFLILTEYTSPQHRGVFLTLKSASAYWGVWVANSIGTVCFTAFTAYL